MSHPTPIELIVQARSGDTHALGHLLDLYRDFMRLQARQQLGTRLSTRVDHSDIVQETLLDVQRDFAGFRGESEAEWTGWLKQILEHNVAEAIRRHVHVQKRSVRMEKSMDESKSPGGALKNRLVGDEDTPSRRAMQAEESVRLNSAIDRMTPDQRQAIRLRYTEGYSLKQLAEHFERSEGAVASLLHRAVERLRCQLSNGHQDGEP